MHFYKECLAEKRYVNMCVCFGMCACAIVIAVQARR